MENSKEMTGLSFIDFVEYFKMYEYYFINHSNATNLIKKLRKTNNDFLKFLEKQEIKLKGFTLESFLILPIQRIPRYELLFKELIKLTLDNNEDKKNIIKCYNAINEVNKIINTKMFKYEQREQVSLIEKLLISNNNSNNNDKKLQTKFLSLVTLSRIFLKKGFLTKVARKKDIKYLFIFFNDLLIYCTELKNSKLILHHRININKFFRCNRLFFIDDDIKDNKDNNKDKNKYHGSNIYFEIHSITKSFLAYADTEKEREEWMDSIEDCIDIINEQIAKRELMNNKNNKNIKTKYINCKYCNK